MKLPPLRHWLDGLTTPLHDPTYWRLHTVPHLIGGAAVALLLWPAHLGAWAIYAVACYQGLRQEVLREQDPANFPPWAMVWDIAADAIGAALLVLIVTFLIPARSAL